MQWFPAFNVKDTAAISDVGAETGNKLHEFSNLS